MPFESRRLSSAQAPVQSLPSALTAHIPQLSFFLSNEPSKHALLMHMDHDRLQDVLTEARSLKACRTLFWPEVVGDEEAVSGADDDLADMPQLHKANGALDTLFIRGRRTQISAWVSSQKLRLISAAVRVNQQFLCCWRLRNQHELEAVIEELSALLPKDKLRRIYEQATRDPYSFLFVYYLKPKNEMFYLRFEERFAVEKEADGGGAQLPGPDAVRQFHTH